MRDPIGLGVRPQVATQFGPPPQFDEPHLKLLFPLALAGVGLRQWVTQGLGLAQVPAYVLLWYAFDSFWKFHRGSTS